MSHQGAKKRDIFSYGETGVGKTYARWKVNHKGVTVYHAIQEVRGGLRAQREEGFMASRE